MRWTPAVVGLHPIAPARDSDYVLSMKHSHHSHHSEYSHHSHHENSANGHPSAAAPQSNQAGIKPKPSRDEVARKAYEIYLKEGCPQGRDVQHWLEAETQMSG